jgi:hypothetical protein
MGNRSKLHCLFGTTVMKCVDQDDKMCNIHDTCLSSNLGLNPRIVCIQSHFLLVLTLLVLFHTRMLVAMWTSVKIEKHRLLT